VADTIAAVVSKKERQKIKNHLITATVKSGGGKLLDIHDRRRQKILSDIYARKVQRRKILDDSFGSQILESMTRVLGTCTSRLAYRENMYLLAGLHSNGLHTGRTTSHQGTTPLHTKITLSIDMTNDMMELHDNCYTAIVTDGGSKTQLRLAPSLNSNGKHEQKIKSSLKIAETVAKDVEWTVSLASDGPTMTERRSDFHPYAKHLDRELNFIRGKQQGRNNVGIDTALRSMSRMLDLIHPLHGTRLTGTVSKAPHKRIAILSDRCEELGYGAFRCLEKGDVRDRKSVV
jgi:hypothetical protein